MTSTDDALATAIKQVAEAKVAEALGGDVLGTMVQAVMDHKDRSSYNRADDKTAFERIVNQHIENMLHQIVREHLATHADSIKAAMQPALVKNADKLATALIDAFLNEDWRATLNIKIIRKDEE